MLATARSKVTDINLTRIVMLAALFAVAMFIFVEPAMAFDTFQTKVTTQTKAATSAAKGILYAAAVLALIIGIVPMLWGQVKVKWIVSCLVAAVLFAIVPTIITAFAG